MANSTIKCPSSDEFMAALDSLKDDGDVIGIPAPDDITDVIIAWANGVKPGDTKNIASRSVSLQRGIEIGMCIMHARQEQAQEVLDDASSNGMNDLNTGLHELYEAALIEDVPRSFIWHKCSELLTCLRKVHDEKVKK